ncbi:MAG: nucleotidyltransferase family protein [Candidatus Omnitrophota bacterium]
MLNLTNSKESNLIFLLSRINLNHAQLQEAQLLIDAKFNWREFFKKAYLLDIYPLLYYNLKSIFDASKTFPAEIYSRIKVSYQFNLANNLKLWTEFLRVKNQFNNIDINHIPLKGMIFIHSLYSKFGLRCLSDIDILIKENDISACEKQLIKLGYQKEKFVSLAYRQKFHCHYSFFNPDKKIMLELHWAFAPPRPRVIDLTEVWQRTKIQVFDNQQVLTLSAEDTLLSLCINLCCNIPNLQFIPFKNLVDINELISQYKQNLDFNYIKDKLVQWKLKGAFYYLYFLTRSYLDTPWPEDFISQITIPPLQKRALSLYPLTLKKRSQLQAIILMFLMLSNLRDVSKLILAISSQTLSIFIQNKKLFSYYLKR